MVSSGEKKLLDNQHLIKNVTSLNQQNICKMNRFCVIDCENSRAFDPFTFGVMFQSQLSREGDDWTICYLAHGETLPDDILEFQGVVITGSHFNCRDGESLPGFKSLCEFIRHASEKGSPRLYGGCYGCQVIAHALHGEVDYNPSGRFLLMAENVKLSTIASENLDTLTVSRELIEKLSTAEGMNLIVSHGDCVRKIPDNSILLASSESCTAEMYITGKERNILGC